MKGVEYKGCNSVDGPIIVVRRSENIFYGEIAAVRDRFGAKKIGRVIDISEDYAIVQIFGTTTGLDLDETTLVEKVHELYFNRKSYIDTMSQSSQLNAVDKVISLIEDAVINRP